MMRDPWVWSVAMILVFILAFGARGLAILFDPQIGVLDAPEASRWILLASDVMFTVPVLSFLTLAGIALFRKWRRV